MAHPAAVPKVMSVARATLGVVVSAFLPCCVSVIRPVHPARGTTPALFYAYRTLLVKHKPSYPAWVRVSGSSVSLADNGASPVPVGCAVSFLGDSRQGLCLFYLLYPLIISGVIDDGAGSKCSKHPCQGSIFLGKAKRSENHDRPDSPYVQQSDRLAFDLVFAHGIRSSSFDRVSVNRPRMERTSNQTRVASVRVAPLSRS